MIYFRPSITKLARLKMRVWVIHASLRDGRIIVAVGEGYGAQRLLLRGNLSKFELLQR